MKNNRLDLVRGSLIGGAAGDALGYPVEFDCYNHIVHKYGIPGITEYELKHSVAEISDDTQMTLFTANGLLMGLTRRYMRGIGAAPHHYVEYAYQDWLYTQTRTLESRIAGDKESYSSRNTWLSALPELYSRRAPGTTCLTAISEMINGHTPQNNSKGCGGVMRIAYVTMNKDGSDVREVAKYEGHKKVWNIHTHEHKEKKTGEVFLDGHVHFWENGKPVGPPEDINNYPELRELLNKIRRMTS